MERDAEDRVRFSLSWRGEFLYCMTVKCCVSCFVGKTQERRVSDIKNYALFRVLHWSFSNQAGCQSTATCETSYCCLFILNVKAVMFGLCQHCSLFFRAQPLMEKVIQTPGFTYILFSFSTFFRGVQKHLRQCQASKSICNPVRKRSLTSVWHVARSIYPY